MKLSPFFKELKSAYDAELDDLMTDSAGHDVLAKRLKVKRSQVSELLPMLDCNPEMVAVAFHGGFRFSEPEVLRELVASDSDALIPWSTLRESIELAPWADDLADVVLRADGGEQFLVVTAGLEYLLGRAESSSESLPLPLSEDHDDLELDDVDLDGNLDEAGEDWLSEQGFERKDRYSGE